MKKTNGLLMVVGIAALFLTLLPAPGQAAIVDLTTAGSSGTVNGAIFQQIDPRATGSGVIDPFVRIGAPADQVQGYNTSFRPLVFDENSSPTFTHDLLLSAVPIVDIGGTNYREFLLDINQTGVDPLLSLDQIQIYMGTSGGLISSPPNQLTDLGTLVYSLDNGGNNWIKLNYNLNTGSGSGDMFAYIPSNLFTGGTHVYFFSQFGTNENNNDGYEEWAVREVPEPATMILLGLGLAGFGLYRRREFKGTK